MKTVLQKSVSVLCMGAVLTCSAFSHQAEAADKNEKIHEAYEKKIAKVEKELDSAFYEGWDKDNSKYFAYYDINKDGVDECIITAQYGTEDKTSLLTATDIAIYTYDKGKVKQLVHSITGGGTWGYFVVRKNSKYITEYARAGLEYDSYRFRAIEKGKLVTKATCIHDESSRKKYTVNKKEVTKKKFNQTAKKNIGTKSITVYKITSENLKKFR